MFKTRHITQVCREAMGAAHAYIEGRDVVTHWDDLTDRQRKLSVSIVNFILAHPTATPSECHREWCQKMTNEEGYTYGEVRDDVAKTHPDLVPYEALHRLSRLYYAITIGIVRGMQDIGARYDNCAVQSVEPPVANAGNPIAEAFEPIVVPLVAAAEETLTQIESTPGDVAIYGIGTPADDAPTVESGDESKVDVQ